MSGIGAEGGTQNNTSFLIVLQAISNFSRKLTSFLLCTIRTHGTLSTELYLSCSSACFEL